MKVLGNRRRALATLFVGAIATSGCVGKAETPRQAGASDVSRDDGQAARRFAEWERASLTDLATADLRLSRRLQILPTEIEAQHAAIGAIFAEDTGLRMVEGRADLFSFDERERELDAIEKRVSAPPRKPVSRDEAAFERLEVELLSRMVAEERGRVREERRLPRSGSNLLRGIVETWVAPATLAALRERDAWLAERVDEIRNSVFDAPLRPVEISELEDALDPLEHFTDPIGFARSEAAIARLRISLGSERAGLSGGGGWAQMQEDLAVHLGLHEGEGALRSEIEMTETRLREEATARLSRLPDHSATAVGRASAEILLVDGVCDGRSSRSLILRAGPPPERAPLCGALRAMGEAKNEDDALAALIAVHDAVQIAEWAVAIRLDDSDRGHVQPGHGLMSEVPPERVGRFVRFAATRPIACIAIARMQRILDHDGTETRQARAKRWIAFGDAPLDIVEREWGAR